MNSNLSQCLVTRLKRVPQTTEERALSARTNPGLNIFEDFNYGGSVYQLNYAPSGACVDLSKSWQTKTSSARLTGTSCCLYEAYKCNESGLGADYLIQSDISAFPSSINDHLGSVICWNGYTPTTCRGSVTSRSALLTNL